MLTNYTIGDNLYISRLRESNSRPPAYKAGAITTMLKRQTDRATSARFELTRAEPSRFRIYRLNHSANLPLLTGKKESGESGFRSRCLVLAKHALYRLS